MQPSPRTVHTIIECIQQLVPPGSPEPQDPNLLNQLRYLTQELIAAYQATGRLQGDPFYDAWTRPLYLYEAEVHTQLTGKVVLVTGGEGCVGGHLLEKLAQFPVQRIVSVDKARCGALDGQTICDRDTGAILYAADIRDYDTLKQIFAIEQPDVVFHLGAQRHPGLAEKLIWETVTSNIFGTQNVIQLCEEFGVEGCVFSSTGKASRYFTGEVYAATKKVSEWLFAKAAQRGNVRYGMVRFTHMLNNSAMYRHFEAKVSAGETINVHAPDRYVVGQNVGEAVHLLLNAFVLSERGRLQFLLVRNLGWPTESLEVALHMILHSGQALPLYFQGIEVGYEESFFLGQVDWDNQLDINTLINALETGFQASISSSGDMTVADVVPYSVAVLDQELPVLKLLCGDRSLPESSIKQRLAHVIRAVGKSTFLLAPTHQLLDILRWGVNPKQFEQGDFCPEKHREILELLTQALAQKLTLDVLENSQFSTEALDSTLSVLANLSSIQQEVESLRAAVCPDLPPVLAAQ